jgi:hypothetical protein
MGRIIATPLARATLALVAGLLLALPVASARGLRVASMQADAGSISGTVVNATQSNAPLGGQQVTLQVTISGQAHDLTSALTDGQGRFSFGDLATGAGDIYAAYTHYQGGLYSTGPLRLDTNPNAQTTLTVYDATSSDANLHVTGVTVLVRQPRPANGLIGMGEFVSFHNSGNTAFVGSMAPANGMPMGLLRFTLPQGTTNLTPGLGFVGAQIAQVNAGFGATATVPPGDSVFAFAFDLPYDGMQALFSYRPLYATDSVQVLVPPTIFVDGRDFTAQGIRQAFGTSYQLFQVNQVAAGTTKTLRIYALPAAGQPSDLDFRALVGLAAALALAIALLAGLYLKRGALARTLGLVPASAHGARIDHQHPQPTDEHQALLRELLKLERLQRAGKLDSETYKRRAGEVRAALRALMLEESAAGGAEQPSAQPTVEADAAEARTLSGGGR